MLARLDPPRRLSTFDCMVDISNQQMRWLNDDEFTDAEDLLILCETPTPERNVWHTDCVLKDDLRENLHSSNKKCTILVGNWIEQKSNRLQRNSVVLMSMYNQGVCTRSQSLPQKENSWLWIHTAWWRWWWAENYNNFSTITNRKSDSTSTCKCFKSPDCSKT